MTGQFMTAFYACYKDGTENPSGQTDNNYQDYRWFAGMYFIFRLMIFATYAFTPDWFMQYMILQLVCTGGLLAFSILRPYKNDWYNRLDATMFAILSAINSLSMYNYFLAILDTSPSVLIFSIQYFLVMCPLAYMVIFVVCYLCIKYHRRVIKWFEQKWPSCKCFAGDNDAENEDFLEYTENSEHLRDIQEYTIDIVEPRNRRRSIQEEQNCQSESETKALLLQDPSESLAAATELGLVNSNSSREYGATESAREGSLRLSDKNDSEEQFFYGVEKMLLEDQPTNKQDKRKRLLKN